MKRSGRVRNDPCITAFMKRCMRQAGNGPTSMAMLLSWLLAVSAPGFAQSLERGTRAYIVPPDSMPAWTVPVLRLVSSTHVEPTTGVILSDTGLVLVPADFAGMDDEIIVLDGGTDIIRNGRPAKIEKKFTAEGLQVLSVQGLERQGVTLAATVPEEGGQVLLTAFPPAEQIALGEPPLSIEATLEVSSETGRPAVTSETRLPNVTGALVDSCGNLVGVSLADDIQTMETSPSTRYRWRETLLGVFGEMQIPLRESECSATPEEEAPAPVEEPVADEPEIPEPEPEAAEEAAAEDPIQEEKETADEDAAPEDTLPEIDILPPIEKDGAGEEPERDTDSPGWWWLAAAVVLFGLGLFLHRLRKARRSDALPSPEASPAAPALSIQSEDEEPEPAEPLLGKVLVIRGERADGTAFEDSCAISESAINVMIGRGETDLVIESPAVSRKHAQLNGTAAELTVSDLGSSNGTSINGVPCLEGEIMYIEPGDTLILGDVMCSIEFAPREPAGSGKA